MSSYMVAHIHVLAKSYFLPTFPYRIGMIVKVFVCILKSGWDILERPGCVLSLDRTLFAVFPGLVKTRGSKFTKLS